MNYRLSVYEKAMPDSLSLHEKLTAAKKAGFDAVELSVDETDEKLARLKMPSDERRKIAAFRVDGTGFDSICLSGLRKYPMGSSDAGTVKRSMQIMSDAIRFAYDAGIRVIQLAGYDVYYNETSTADTKKRFTENLIRAAEEAASFGVLLGLETMETEFLNTVNKGMEYVKAVSSSYLGMYPDIGNIRNATPDVAQDLKTGVGHIFAAHIKETHQGVFRNMHYGEGRVNFGELLPTLKGLDVRFFNAEFWYDEKYKNGDWCSALKEANDFIRSILK